MKVISTTDVSRYGNDCYIEESYSLVEQFDVYSIIRFYKVSGWSDREEVSVIFTSSNEAEVRKKYKEYCKYFKA
jgi:hypothetical protein